MLKRGHIIITRGGKKVKVTPIMVKNIKDAFPQEPPIQNIYKQNSTSWDIIGWRGIVIYGDEAYTKKTKGENNYEIMKWLDQHKKLAKKRGVFYDIQPILTPY